MANVSSSNMYDTLNLIHSYQANCLIGYKSTIKIRNFQIVR